MKDISLNKCELIDILEKNVELYRSVYKEAMNAFIYQYNKCIDKVRRKAEEGIYSDYLNAPTRPENNIKDYTVAIDALKRDTRSIVTIDSQEYAQLVLNDWGWKEKFRQSYMGNTGYSGFSGYSSEAKEFFKE